MSIAVQPPDAPPIPTANPRTTLVVSSLVGALFVLGGLFLAGYAIPTLWDRALAPTLNSLGGFFNVFLKLAVQIAFAGLFFLGTKLAGNNPPKGLRGGIFLCVSVIITVFFLVRAVGLNLEASTFGPYVTLAVLVGLIFASYKYLLSDRAERTMYAVEDGGWFHTHTFKRTQGLKVRRWTMVGVLIVGLTGAWTLAQHDTFGFGDLKLAMPFGIAEFVPLTTIQYSGPFLVALATFWFAWRLVNVPTFADFLIATEAEMNKVSWSTRRRLYQDTIVVLVTLAIMTLFLFVVDIFWGWLLSRSVVGVLPAKKDTPNKPAASQRLSW